VDRVKLCDAAAATAFSNPDVGAQIHRFDATWSAVKDHVPTVDFDSDEALGAVLRRELIEIACFNGVSDPETLLRLRRQEFAG
jgi:hypothetical protein